MTDRSIEALGFTDVPALQPLTYPGRIIDEPVLLSGRELPALQVRRQRLGDWLVVSGDEPHAVQHAQHVGHHQVAHGEAIFEPCTALDMLGEVVQPRFHLG